MPKIGAQGMAILGIIWMMIDQWNWVFPIHFQTFFFEDLLKIGFYPSQGTQKGADLWQSMAFGVP